MGVAAPGAKSRVQPCNSVILVRNNVTYNPAVRLALYIEMHTQTSPATAVPVSIVHQMMYTGLLTGRRVIT